MQRLDHGRQGQAAAGRALRKLPACEEAWLSGDVNCAHVDQLVAARRPATEGALDRDEELLVGQAKNMRFRGFVRAVAYWLQQADPDGAEKSDGEKHAGRRAHLSQSFDGMWFGDMVFDPISGTIVSEELCRIEDELFQADWAEARRRLGRDPVAADLARTAAQRRADAMVEMAIRSATAPADGRRPEPLFTVVINGETLFGRMCELANGTVVAPGSLVRWLDRAWLERVVFESPSRVCDVGVARRLFSGATRRAVEVRDRECFHDLCDVQAERCEIDHVVPYSAGGETTQANGRPGCAFHNRGRHKRRERRPDP